MRAPKCCHRISSFLGVLVLHFVPVQHHAIEKGASRKGRKERQEKKGNLKFLAILASWREIYYSNLSHWSQMDYQIRF
jgi:hypothetical protein